MYIKTRPPEPIKIEARMDGRYQVVDDGLVVKVSYSYEQCRAWVRACRPTSKPDASNLIKAIQRL